MGNWFPGLAGSRYPTRAQVQRLLEITAQQAVSEALAVAIQTLDADTIAALNLKADEADFIAHVADLANPHVVTKTQVGLGNVDNTSDLNKPISTAVQAALDTKANHGYVDIDFPIIIRDTGPSRPVVTTIVGNLAAPQWDVNDWVQIEDQEMIHGWREASQVQWHVHLLTAGTDVTDRYVRYEVEWAWANAFGQLSSAIITTSPDILIPANTPDRTHLPAVIAMVDLPTMDRGAHIYARLQRVASVGTAPTTDIFCSMLQLHVDTDSYGIDDLPGFVP